HSQRVVHRDIKPENILFSGGHALVADFGIARVLETAGAERLTETGVGLGTPHYMSPEQSMGESAIDGRSDLYALASVLYEMLAGEPPFTGPNAQAIIAKRLSQPVPSVRVVRETVPEPIDAALSQALALSPADRFLTTGEFVTAISAPAPLPLSSKPSSPPRRKWTRRLVLALAVPPCIGAGWYLFRPRPVIPAAASVIAVLPLVPATSDTGLERLGRDLANTVSASLDGVGEVRTVDRLTVLAQVQESSGALPLDEGAAVGRRLGAASVVYGSLAREGPRVRIDLGLYTTDSLAPLARMTILAHPESLSAITDSLTRKLLLDIWRHGGAPTPTLEAALTTRSVEALRAYLDGEQNLVAGKYHLAREAYGRAIAADSSFWFAWYRYGNALGWAELDVDSATEAAYRTHRELLPERERLMIEASRPDSGLSRQRAQLEEIVRHYPDYWPAWWILGDNLWHIYPQIGADLADAQQALEKVVELNPSMVYAWQHLGAVYAERRDTTGLIGVLDNLQRLGARSTFIQTEQVDHVFLLQSALAVLRGKPKAEVVLDSIYSRVVKGGMLPFDPSYQLLWMGEPALQVVLNRRLLKSGLAAEDARETSDALALALATRGAWDEALKSREQFTPSPDDSLWAVTTYRLAVLAAWLGAVPISEATRLRPEAERLVTTRGPGYRAELAWLDGVLAVAADDSLGLKDARLRIQATKAGLTAALDRSLEAFEMALRGDRGSAGRMMAALEWELAEREPWFMMSRATPHGMLRAIDRMAAAEWLLAAGDGEQAAQLLRWPQAAAAPFSEKLPLAPLADLMAARIAD
ncbi:MAG TPA: serine/threonine-protein kinase, partial [Gemmatimonadales bacterium]|nr:serine/threonine-protein kinase [Gemmatimonadales bacterium]